MFTLQVGRAGLQAVYFVLLARTLGASNFGGFSGVVALVAILQPFGSLGAINLLVLHVANDRRAASVQFSTAIAITASSGIVVVAGLAACSRFFAPHAISPAMVVAIAAADLIGARIVDIASALYQSMSMAIRTAILPLFVYGARLTGALALLASSEKSSLSAWVAAYFIASIVATAGVVIFVFRDIGCASPNFRAYASKFSLGILFSFSLAAQSIYNDIDKAMLVKLSTLTATGIYSAAYRIVDLSFTPVRALLAAAYPQFFRVGRLGLEGTVSLSRRLAAFGLPYSVAASAILFGAAGLIPHVLGSSYAESVEALRWLAVLPILKAIHYLAADALTGALLQRIRTTCQAAVAVGNVALNLWLIPAYGWQGAVASSLASDGALAVALWLTVLMLLRAGRARGAVDRALYKEES